MIRESAGRMEINITHSLSGTSSLKRVARTGGPEIDPWRNVIHDLRTIKNDRSLIA